MKTMIKTVCVMSIACAMTITACKKDENKPSSTTTTGGSTTSPNPQEVITTLKLTFTDSATSAISSAIFRDPDGDGGQGPTKFDTITLSANKTYLVEVELFDESKTPVDTVSNEVEEESNDHQFFFHHAGVNITTSYEDKDANNLPIGLQTKWRTKTAGTLGTSQIVLKHQPGVKNGTETPGEIDIDVTFKSEIK